jgi:hypothetical protein
VAVLEYGGMATEAHSENYLELFDVSKNESIGRRPLDQLRFIPRTGERLFLPLHGTGNWTSYTVVAVEYFLGYDPATAQPSNPSAGISRITLYVEQSK